MTSTEILNWFKIKRPIYTNPRIIVHNNIAFVYGSMLIRDVEKCIARINLENKVSLDELNPFEWIP